MPDKEDKRDIGHAMFGFNEPRPSRNDPGQQTGAPEAGPGQPPPPGQPQYVYVQAPPPAPLPIPQEAPPTSRLVIGVLVLLVILAVVNLYLALSQRSQFGKALEIDANQLTLLRTRMDASDDRYAQLKGQFDVTSEKLGMTQQELARARQLTATIQRQQHAAVEQLNSAIG